MLNIVRLEKACVYMSALTLKMQYPHMNPKPCQYHEKYYVFNWIPLYTKTSRYSDEISFKKMESGDCLSLFSLFMQTLDDYRYGFFAYIVGNTSLALCKVAFVMMMLLITVHSHLPAKPLCLPIKPSPFLCSQWSLYQHSRIVRLFSKRNKYKMRKICFKNE